MAAETPLANSLYTLANLIADIPDLRSRDQLVRALMEVAASVAVLERFFHDPSRHR